MRRMREVKKEVATSAIAERKQFEYVLENGSKVKLQIDLEVSDFTSRDLEEILAYIDGNSRSFYLAVAEKSSGAMNELAS